MSLVAFQLLCVVLTVAVFRSRPHSVIASDGKSYYVWLRSMALDHDIDFRNDYRLIYPPDPLPIEADRRTPAGLAPNKYPVGVALTEIPGFLVGQVVAAVTGSGTDGVSGPYQVSVALWLQLVCIASLLALWRGMIHLGADPAIAALTVASALLCTNLIQYVVRPSMPHGPGLAALSFAFYFATRDRARHSIATCALVGLLLGLAVIIRAPNVVMLLFFAPLLLDRVRRSVASGAAIAGGIGFMLAIQLALTSALWGKLTFSGYADEGFTSGLTGVVNTLFSSRHGLFVYHPWYLLAIVVCALATRDRSLRPIAATSLAAFGLLAVINGTWWCWWFGDSFGNRAFIESLLPLAVVAALWLSRQRLVLLRSALGVVACLALANAVLWTGYVLRRFPPDGRHTVAEAYLWFVR